jgi:uncharacterized protein YrrD
LRTFTLLKGLPVYDSSSGKAAGIVSDLEISNNGLVKSVVVDMKGLFERDRLISVDDVVSFGTDGVMIKKLNTLSSGFEKKNHYFCHQSLLGKLLYSKEGEKLGIIEDVYFDSNLGTILGYEVSEGFFADLSEGKKIIKTNNPIQFGEDIILIEIDT